MGMYDTINVQVPLPDGWQPPDGELQTSDFESVMTIIELRADGTLWIDVAAGVFSGLDKVDPDRWEHQADLEGWIDFMGLERIKPPAKDDGLYRGDEYQSHYYRAKFKDGKLLKIVMDLRMGIDPPDDIDDDEDDEVSGPAV